MLKIQTQIALQELGAIRGVDGARGVNWSRIATSIELETGVRPSSDALLTTLEELEELGVVWSTVGAAGRLVFYFCPVSNRMRREALERSAR